MRLVVILMTLLLFIGVLGFALTNLETRVGIVVWETLHPDVPLFAVVVLAVLAGIVYAGVIALAEGAQIRLANHKMSRELRRLEAELTYLRTQPAVRRTEPDAVPESRAPSQGPDGDPERSPASAPVYEADEGWSPEPEDDAYSGGRAV